MAICAMPCLRQLSPSWRKAASLRCRCGKPHAGQGSRRWRPYRHFADKEALLAGVAAIGFERFAAALALADTTPDPRQALIAQGVAYVTFAGDNPALFRLMFGAKSFDLDGDLAVQGHTAYGVLAGRVASLSTPGASRHLDARLLVGSSMASPSLAPGWKTQRPRRVARRARRPDAEASLDRRLSGALPQAAAFLRRNRLCGLREKPDRNYLDDAPAAMRRKICYLTAIVQTAAAKTVCCQANKRGECQAEEISWYTTPGDSRSI